MLTFIFDRGGFQEGAVCECVSTNGSGNTVDSERECMGGRMTARDSERRSGNERRREVKETNK